MFHTVSSLINVSAPPGDKSGICSVCGYDGNGQYERQEILDKTSANLTAIFDMNHTTICHYCVGVWKEPKKLHRAIYADPDRVVFPVISTESATDDRPTWSSLIRHIPIDSPRIVILTTDPKKRVWPLAKVSNGQLCAIYTHDPSRGISGNVWVIINELRAALDLIEQAYSLGFSKPAIASSLYTSHKTISTVGLEPTRQLEDQLRALRPKSEFNPALIMAQKGNDEPT